MFFLFILFPPPSQLFSGRTHIVHTPLNLCEVIQFLFIISKAVADVLVTHRGHCVVPITSQPFHIQEAQLVTDDLSRNICTYSLTRT